MSRELITSKLLNDDRVPDLRHKAYILATIAWETGYLFQPVKEAYWLSERWRMENLRYAPAYGRGLIQITFHENYVKAERFLPSHPPLSKNYDLALDPDIAYDIAVLGMKQGWFTGRHLDDYIHGDHCDFFQARRIINGLDRAKTIEMLAKKYLSLFSHPIESPEETNDEILQQGSKGEAVVALQKRLNRYFIIKGFDNYTPIKEDGVFGPITQGIVMKFQRAKGLIQDGIVGPTTYAKLFT